MTSTPKLVDRPTRRQLAYLRSLATRTGQTFAYPHTRGEARPARAQEDAKMPSGQREGRNSQITMSLHSPRQRRD